MHFWSRGAHPRLPMLLPSVQEVSEQLVQAALSAGFKAAITKGSGREVWKASRRS